MKRRGRGFADGADVNAGDEADVSGDVAASQDARGITRCVAERRPRLAKGWRARVSDLARVSETTRPEKHAMTRANDDGPAPYSNTSPEVLEVLSPERSAIHSTTKCPSAYDVAGPRARVAADRARASRRFWKTMSSSESAAIARTLLAGLENETRALDASAFSLRETVYEKKRLAETFALAKTPRAGVEGGGGARGERPRRATTTRRRVWRRVCGSRLTENKKHAVAAAPARAARRARCGLRAACGPPLGGGARRAPQRRRATYRDAVGGVAPTRATRRRRVRPRGKPVERDVSARARRASGRGRRGEEGARSRDKGRARCARALAYGRALGVQAESRYPPGAGPRASSSRRWRFGIAIRIARNCDARVDARVESATMAAARFLFGGDAAAVFPRARGSREQHASRFGETSGVSSFTERKSAALEGVLRAGGSRAGAGSRTRRRKLPRARERRLAEAEIARLRRRVEELLDARVEDDRALGESCASTGASVERVGLGRVGSFAMRTTTPRGVLARARGGRGHPRGFRVGPRERDAGDAGAIEDKRRAESDRANAIEAMERSRTRSSAGEARDDFVSIDARSDRDDAAFVSARRYEYAIRIRAPRRGAGLRRVRVARRDSSRRTASRDRV